MVQQQQEEQSTLDAVTNYIVDNKLKTVLYTWAGGISVCLGFQWSRPIPTSLKIIHSRVYAQALTLAALGAVAGVEMYAAAQNGGDKKEVDKHGY